MNKQSIIALALSVSAFSFAQKKEIKTAEKAVKASNFSEAMAALKQVEPLLESADEKIKSKYYYLKGVALFANGAGNGDDVESSLESISKVKGAYGTEIKALRQSISNSLLTKGNDAYEKKEFSIASSNFERVYNMNKKDTLYLYYAAATAVSAPDYPRALKLYAQLKDLGYTGIETKYYAVNKETQEKETFTNAQLRNLSVKAKTHLKPTDEKSESKKAEIVRNVALIYVSEGDEEKALEAVEEARVENPDDVNLVLTAANLYYKMGNTEEFQKLLKIATAMDPENPDLQYNLGVIAAESEDVEAAKAYYAKAIELDPNYINAYINSAALVLEGESVLVEEMNNLGTSDADDKRYDELKAEKETIYRSAIPLLEKALSIDEKNESAVKTLLGIYSVLGETEKREALKAKTE
ncbi:MAG: tetratricopeptide repeat protein [Algibacter sp.]